MKDLIALVEQLETFGAQKSNTSNEIIKSAELAVSVRNTIALERIADALEVLIADDGGQRS